MIRRPAAALLAAVALAVLAFGRPAIAATFDVPTDDFYTVFEDHQLVLDAASGVFSNDLSSRGPCVAGLDLAGLQRHLPLDSLGPNGQVNFSPAIDFNGATSFKYTLGLVNGLGCDSTGNSATVTITVFELNDPPSILLESPCTNGITVAEDSGAFDGAQHCVEMLGFGPVDENNQSFDAWLVSSTNPSLFSAKPKIAAVDGLFGRLTFTPAANAHGTSTVTVRGRDGAGTSDGGDDTSDPVKFKITVTAVDDPTPVPTQDETPVATAEASTLDASPEATADAGPTSVATAAATDPAPTSTASPSNDAAGSDGGVSPVVILLGVLLAVLLVGFGAAVYLPKRRINSGR